MTRSHGTSGLIFFAADSPPASGPCPAHGRQIDDRRHAGEVLQHDAPRHERDLDLADLAAVVGGELLHVLLDDEAVDVPQARFEQHLDRVRQRVDAPRPARASSRKTTRSPSAVDAGAGADGIAGGCGDHAEKVAVRRPLGRIVECTMHCAGKRGPELGEEMRGRARTPSGSRRGRASRSPRARCRPGPRARSGARARRRARRERRRRTGCSRRARSRRARAVAGRERAARRVERRADASRCSSPGSRVSQRRLDRARPTADRASGARHERPYAHSASCPGARRTPTRARAAGTIWLPRRRAACASSAVTRDRRPPPEPLVTRRARARPAKRAVATAAVARTSPSSNGRRRERRALGRRGLRRVRAARAPRRARRASRASEEAVQRAGRRRASARPTCRCGARGRARAPSPRPTTSPRRRVVSDGSPVARFAVSVSTMHVRGQPLAVRAQERREVLGADLLLALDDELHVHGQPAPAPRPGADRGEVEHHARPCRPRRRARRGGLAADASARTAASSSASGRPSGWTSWCA